MRFFGSCVETHRGTICRLTTETGNIPVAVLVGGKGSGVWERLLEIFISEPDFEWLMIDASHINVTSTLLEYMTAMGIWDAQNGLNSKIHSAVDAHGMPVGMFITAGSVADCSHACGLIEGTDAEYLLTDEGYDGDALVACLQQSGVRPAIPPRKSCKFLRHYDKYLYRVRHLIENAFLELKR